MQIHQKHRKILLSGILVIVLMGLYPPWLYTRSHAFSYSEIPAGYSFILSAPKPEYSSSEYGVKIDIPRLFIQWVLVVAAMGAVILFVKKEEKNSP